MNLDEANRVEDTFRNSTSSDELFDAFQKAIRIKLNDINIFKILIANPTLTPNEIKMFTEKLLKEIPNNAFELLLWTGKIFESLPKFNDHLEDTILFYQRAISHKPTTHEPLVKLLNLFNHDVNLPTNQIILNLVDEFVAGVDRKSEVYYALAKHYKKRDHPIMEKQYLRLAEECAKREREQFNSNNQL